MRGRVARELWLRRYVTGCSSCGVTISAQCASYYCKECRYSLCMDCAAPDEMLPTRSSTRLVDRNAKRTSGAGGIWRPDDIMAGDILMYGPDWWGIHHVVLSRGPMRPADAQTTKLLVEHEPHLAAFELFECETIESSRPLRGTEHPWYPALTYFGRKRTSDGFPYGELRVIADMADNTNTIGVHNTPVPVKLLLHPLRPGRGAPALDLGVFKAAVDLSAETSQRWSKGTALSAMAAARRSLDSEDFKDAAARSKLMEDLRRRWCRRPICSSVAIQTWQRYFELLYGSGPAGTDLAAQHILRWMPVLSDRTAPSALLKALSTCGWVLRENLDA